MKKNIGILFLILTLNACEKAKKESKFKNKTALSEVKKISFNLDENSTINIYSAGFHHSNQKNEVFSFLNINNNSLVVYNKYDSPEVINLDKEGENGIGEINGGSSHKFISKDSLLILQSDFGKMYLLNSKGKILNTYSLFENKNINKSMTYAKAGTNAPILYSNKSNTAIIRTSLLKLFEDYSNVKVIQKLNIKTNNTEKIATLSKKYDSNFWGTMFKYDNSICFTGNNSLFVSFPIEDYIFEIDFNGKILNKHLFKSSLIPEKTLPMNDNKVYGNINNNPDWNRIKTYSLSTSDYASLFYDDIRKVYHRLVYLRPSLEKVNRGEKYPDFSIVTMDENFKIIGEKRFDQSIYSNSIILMTKDGLAIARKDKYKEDDTKLVFSIFNMKK